MTADLVERLRAMFADDPYGGMGEDRILLEAADALEAAEVVVDLWGPVERGQSAFTDALSSLREALKGSQDQHSEGQK